MAVIAVDCDEVLTESLPSLIQYVKEVYDHEWIYDDVRDYMLSGNPHLNLTHEMALELFVDYYNSSHAENAEAVEGAYEVLKKWKEEGHRLIVVTARNEQNMDITYRQLNKHFPDIFDDVMFASHYTDKHVPKSQLCQVIGAEYLIDDNLDYALEAVQCSIKVFLLERPWNKHRDETHEHICRVKHRSEIDIPTP